jgi:hypothetical protein
MSAYLNLALSPVQPTDFPSMEFTPPTWSPASSSLWVEHEEVKVHDFADKELGKVVPYGVYDLTHNQG